MILLPRTYQALLDYDWAEPAREAEIERAEIEDTWLDVADFQAMQRAFEEPVHAAFWLETGRTADLEVIREAVADYSDFRTLTRKLHAMTLLDQARERLRESGTLTERYRQLAADLGIPA